MTIVVNDLLKKALTVQESKNSAQKKFNVEAFDLKLKSGIDSAKLNQLASDIEQEELLAKINRSK